MGRDEHSDGCAGHPGRCGAGDLVHSGGDWAAGEHQPMMSRYRVWDGFHTDYTAWLTAAEVVELRRRGFYVIPV